ncbi:MAG: DUF177 domain-containing protein [Oscillospiraceae bacterium]|nr:DUF177 domain-containing protein [Oscillospiraceae bacterium]
MILDLREIIGVPGGIANFDYEPDLSDAAVGSVVSIKLPARAAGSVENRAGALTLTAIVDVICLCVCARCLDEFEQPITQHISCYLTGGGEDGEDPDSYLLQGDKIDVDEIILTEFILDLEETLLCSEDCEGICDKCGADLNDGQCDCDEDIDPRLAILGQFFDNDGDE